MLCIKLLIAVWIYPASDVKLDNQRQIRVDVKRGKDNVEQAEDDSFFDLLASAQRYFTCEGEKLLSHIFEYLLDLKQVLKVESHI